MADEQISASEHTISSLKRYGGDGLRALRDEGLDLRVCRCGLWLRREQVGENAAAEHFFHDCLGRDGDGYGYGFAFADFILENAQGFVERVDEEVDDARAHGLAECGGMGRGGEGGGAADVAGDGEDAAPLIEFAGVEEFAAETVLAGSGEVHQVGVSLFYLGNEGESVRRMRVDRQ